MIVVICATIVVQWVALIDMGISAAAGVAGIVLAVATGVCALVLLRT